MTLTPLLTAPTIIQVHVAFACIALVSGPFPLFMRLARRPHRIVGYVWITGMAGLALSALAIRSHGMAFVGPFGPLHLLAVLTPVSLWRAVTLARTGRIAQHARVMKLTWFGGMGVAGLMTFLPGRTINRMAFGGPSDAGLVVIAVGGVALLALWHRDRTRPHRRPIRSAHTIGA